MNDLRSEWMSVMSAHTPNYEGWLESLVISERQARLSAETKLRELQDAIEYRGRTEFSEREKNNGLEIYVKLGKADNIIKQAIQESRTRGKTTG